MIKFHIHKAGGIIIQNRKLLVERSQGKEFFIAPGGSLESNETAKEALVRELKEEFSIDVLEKNFEKFGIFFAKAAGDEKKTIRMDVFIVKQWTGEIIPDNEVEEIRWINSSSPSDIKIGSIFEHEVLPRLKKMDLID